MRRNLSRASWAAAVIFLQLGLVAQAAPQEKARRFGFQGFNASYVGGYAITSADGTNLSGEAHVLIRAPKNGRSARVAWTNTFYTEKGSYRVTLRWNFLPNGVLTANTIDPRSTGAPAAGAFTLNSNHPPLFTISTPSGITATGKLKLIGGGALGITVTVSGLPEGEVTYSFSGGRVN
jgi:hypothetical protein